MASNIQAPSDHVKRKNGHEGPRNHWITFAISMALTIIAFLAASIKGLDPAFVYGILVTMAIVQVWVQLAFWMHMKDRGHFWPILGIVTGVFVVLLIVAMAVWLLWW